MKKMICWVIVMLMLLTACSNSGDVANGELSWQEQYDLGVRYLSEGNYQEAIIAFTAAIEIDPQRAEAYVGRGDAFILSGDTEENLTAAQSDYEKAIELDEANPDAYLGLAEVFIRRGEYDKASEVLKSATDKSADDQRIQSKISDVQDGVFKAYRKVLDLLYNGYIYGWEFYYGDAWESGPAPDQELEVSYLWYWPYAADEIQSLSDIGYMLIDLNEDGVPELITSVFSEYWGSGDGFIYDLYTYRDGKIISLASSGERYRYYLCSDNSLWYEGSSGVAESYFGYYRINKNKTGIEETAGNGASAVTLHLTSLDGYHPLTEKPNSAESTSPLDNTPAGDVSLFPIDYTGLTIGDLAALWGNDYQLGQYWLAGAAKGVYYNDWRVPLTFYFLDDDLSNTVDETDEIIIVIYNVWIGSKIDNITSEIPANATYSQLVDLGYPLTLLDDTDYVSDNGASATAFLEYTSSITIMFDWFDTNPYNSPAEIITISSH